MTKVLLIDDDVELADMLKEYLEAEGFEAEAVHDGEQGSVAALSGNYQIVVLDVMMPRLNGIDTLRNIRTRSNIPVIMLTAKGDDADRILGLELGADDYVPKPCNPRELTARIRSILRRANPAVLDEENSAPLQVGQLNMWSAQRRAEWDGQALNLTSTEFNLLEVLARHAGQTVSKNMLSEQGLGRPLARFERSIDVHLSSIRAKISALNGGESCIHTVYRQGYQLIRE